MGADKQRIIKDPVYGYRRLDPVPRDQELVRYYESHYYDLIRKGGGDAGIRRLMAGGEEAERERAWLSATLYADIYELLAQHAGGKRVLDVGCGTGEALAYLKDRGFETVGIEPSAEAAAAAKARGIAVYSSPLEKLVEQHKSSGAKPFSAVLLLNVLEHVPDPVGLIKLTREVLEPRGGVLCVKVPNDFSELQLAAGKQLAREPWWIAVPDHINYFDFDSMHTLLERLGFRVVHSQSDFPMEFFLLAGDDYLGNPEVGSKCHQRRVSFEMALPGELRRRLYRALATVGAGRCCLVLGRLEGRRILRSARRDKPVQSRRSSK
ncbi:MAG: class I SAM-dependent methyltransferase [Chloroflexi bacterium]|nr:class I SAM-dependent methyltransferase [Chloroflexota bacterium]